MKVIQNLYLSNSAIQIFKICKKRFKLKYIDRMKTPVRLSSKNLSFGNSMHSALAEFNYVHDEKYRTLEILQNLLRKNWIRDGYSSIDEERAYGLKALKMLEDYFNNPLDIGKNTFFVESMVQKKLDNNIILSGKIDKTYTREDDIVEVLDYKTSDNVSVAENPHENEQLLIYLLLAQDRLGFYPGAISFYFLSQNIKISHNVTNEDINAANDFLTNIINQITSEQIFEPSPTRHCKSMCEYYFKCDIAHDMSTVVIKELLQAEDKKILSDVF